MHIPTANVRTVLHVYTCTVQVHMYMYMCVQFLCMYMYMCVYMYVYVAGGRGGGREVCVGVVCIQFGVCGLAAFL